MPASSNVAQASPAAPIPAPHARLPVYREEARATRETPIGACRFHEASFIQSTTNSQSTQGAPLGSALRLGGLESIQPLITQPGAHTHRYPCTEAVQTARRGHPRGCLARQPRVANLETCGGRSCSPSTAYGLRYARAIQCVSRSHAICMRRDARRSTGCAL